MTTLLAAYPGVFYPGTTYPGYMGTITTLFPILTPALPPPLTSHRVTRFQYELLDSNGHLIGPLDGVQPGGSLAWSANQAVKGGGNLTVNDSGQTIDWLSQRIRITAVVTDATGDTTIPLGVWIPSTPTDQWTDTGRTWPVALLDVTSLLDMRTITSNYTMPVGEVVTDWIWNLLADTGLPYALTHSTLTTPVVRTWPAGTTYLQVVNDLLASINWLSLYADGLGVLHADPYTPPSQRGVAWSFEDGQSCIYSPSWQRTQDWSSVPNQVVLTTQGGATTAGLVSTFTAPTTAPWSSQSTGRVRTYAGQVNAADQATLDALAARMYAQLAAPQATVAIRHALVPLAVNQVTLFRSMRAGIPIPRRHVVSSTKVTLTPTALTETTMTEVVT